MAIPPNPKTMMDIQQLLQKLNKVNYTFTCCNEGGAVRMHLHAPGIILIVQESSYEKANQTLCNQLIQVWTKLEGKD